MSGDIEFDFAAAIVAGVLGGLLIFDLGIDDHLQVGPVDGLADAAAIDEERGRAGDVERAAFRHFLLDFGLGGLGVHAGAELDGVERLVVLGPGEDLILQVLGREGFLLGEDQIVIIPEGVGILLEDAAAGHGGGLGPGVEAFERKILEVEAHLLGIVLDQILAQHLRLRPCSTGTGNR